MYYFLIFSCGKSMSEPVKRNSTRERKPNRFFQPDDSEVVNYSGSRLAEHREMRPVTSQANQIAKLLTNFIQSINSKYRDYPNHHHQQTEPPIEPHDHAATYRPRNSSKNTSNNDLAANSQPAKRGGDSRRTGNDENVRITTKAADKKKTDPSKQHPLENANSEQDFATLVANLPKSKPENNPNSIPYNRGNPQKSQQERQTIEHKAAQQRENKKKVVWPVQTKGPQLKPFKRQSYHVAIAYHIHLKKVHPNHNSNTNQIDPTYNARKLRDQQQRR